MTATTHPSRQQELEAPDAGPRCEICGEPATCFGVYEVPEDAARYACDRCCGHGNENGWCKPVSEGGVTR